jgi:hypothetical protein
MQATANKGTEPVINQQYNSWVGQFQTWQDILNNTVILIW